jgi:parallel beta-helix repeat protein
VSVFDFMTAAQIANVQARLLTIDVTAAINAAVTAAAAAFVGTVKVPSGAYLVSAPINRPADIYIVGDGPELTAIYAASTFNGNIFQSAGAFNNVFNRGGIENLAIFGIWGTNNANTLSVGISSSFTNRAIYRDVRIHGCYRGMYGIGVWQDLWENVHVDGAGTQQNYDGFYLDQLLLTLPSGTSNAVNAIHCTVQGNANVGFRLLNPNGSKFTGCEGENGTIGMLIGNTAAGCYPIQFFTCTGMLCDTNSQYGIVVQQGSNAVPCTYMQFANCWTSTHGLPAMFLDGCTYINISNHQAGGNVAGGIYIHNSQYCVVNGVEMQGNNTGNTAGIGDITIDGGQYNRVIGCMSQMANSTSVSVLEKGGTNNNDIDDCNLFQGATLVGANSQIRNCRGYAPSNGVLTAGASPWSSTVQTVDCLVVLTTVAGITALTLKGVALPMTLGSSFFLKAGQFFIATWATTAPVFTFIPQV